MLTHDELVRFLTPLVLNYQSNFLDELIKVCPLNELN